MRECLKNSSRLEKIVSLVILIAAAVFILHVLERYREEINIEAWKDFIVFGLINLFYLIRRMKSKSDNDEMLEKLDETIDELDEKFEALTMKEKKLLEDERDRG